MSCPNDNELAAFLEGTASEAERAELERHLDDCSSCRGLIGEAVLGATRREGFGAAETPSSPAGGGDAEHAEPGSLEPGEMVDHFCVVQELGAGGMGRVYLARDTKLSRKVALKLIQPALVGSERIVRMFRREAKAMARISHPNIVAVHSVGEHCGTPYVALEYVRGDTLQERFRDGAARPVEALRIGLGLAEGLAEAHRHGIVHRDLKPSNVLLGKDDRPRIVDFGLADFVRGRGEAVAAHTDAATFFPTGHTAPTDGGTPSYMAPEQWRAEPATGATDMWALGVILWEILSGERLFKGRSEIDLAGQICGDEALPSLPVGLGLPSTASELIEACLQRPASERPAAADAADALRRSIEHMELAPLMRSMGVELETGRMAAKRLPPSAPPASADGLGDDAPTVPREPSASAVAASEPPRDRRGTPGALGDLDTPSGDEAQTTHSAIIFAAVALMLVGLAAVGLGASQPFPSKVRSAGSAMRPSIDEPVRDAPSAPVATTTPTAQSSASSSASSPSPTPPGPPAAPPAPGASSTAEPDTDIFDSRH